MPAPLRPVRLAPWQRLAATFGATLVVLIFGALAYRGALRERATVRTVGESRDVIEELHRALSWALDGETGQRGYLLTDSAAYLEPYARARDSVLASVRTLRELTHRDVPAQRARVDSLGFLLGAKFDELAETVALARGGDRAAALAVVASGRGKETMDQARAVAGRIERHEIAELEALEARQVAYEARLIFTLLLGTALATAVSLLLNTLLGRYGSSQERFAAELEGANQLLEEQQVELELQNEQLAEQSMELETQNAHLQELTGELEARTDAAEAANLAKARFLAAMSHDLRTPLNAIGGYVDLLEMGIRGPVTEAQAADLQRIRHSSRRLLAMINDILGFARLEAGRVEVRPEPVPLNAAVREMESSFLPQAAARGLEYAFVPAEDELRVYADPEKMQQVLLNLVTNAIKFTEPGGKITLSCEADGDAVRIRVRDTGRGIEPEKLPGIFEPFVQVDRDKTAEEHQGVGLGLAISRELARAMGGELSAESQPGAGSTFTLRLLCAEAAVPLPRFAFSPADAAPADTGLAAADAPGEPA